MVSRKSGRLQARYSSFTKSTVMLRHPLCTANGQACDEGKTRGLRLSGWTRRSRWEISASRKRSSNEETGNKRVYWCARNAVSAGIAGGVPAVDELRADGACARESARRGNHSGSGGSL